MSILARAALVGAVVALVTGCSAGSAPTSATSGSDTAGASTGPNTAAPATPSTSATASAGPSVATAPSTRPPTSGSTTSTQRSTTQVVVRPVTAAGAVVSGWTVRRDTTTIDCSGGLRSPVSRSADVLFCSPSAASATACWHAGDRSRAYCLPDPRARVLIEYRLQGSAFPASRPVELPPAPAALQLVGPTDCDVRDGGAAARLDAHPDWVPYYFCGAGASSAAWAPQNAADGGVTRADGLWTVQLADADGSGALRTVGVATAYFVGTA